MNNPFVVITVHDRFYTAYAHEKQGHGRSARRRLLDVVHVPRLQEREPLPTVLRRVAAQLEVPPAQRWQPPA